MSATVEECGQGPRELPRVPLESGPLGVLDQLDEHRVLDGEPVEGPVGLGAGLDRDCLHRSDQVDRLPVGMQRESRVVGTEQVMVQHPADRRRLLRLEVRLAGHLDRVRTEQVVLGEPVRPDFAEQVGLGQIGQRRSGVGHGHPGQARRGGGADVWSRMMPQRPEQMRRLGPERPVGPGEHRSHVAGGISSGEGRQPGRLGAQLAGQIGQRPVGSDGGLGRHHRERQREADRAHPG